MNIKEETIVDVFQNRVNRTPGLPAHFTLGNQKEGWVKTTWKAYFNQVLEIAAGLRNLGLEPGQNIGILAITSQNWELVQMAILLLGGVVVGIDPNEIRENTNHIVKTAKIKGLIFQNAEILKKVDNDLLNDMDFKICIDSHSEQHEKEGDYQYLKDVVISDKKVKNVPCSQDPATIIFTSGTTGDPKGILYTHGQIFKACKSILSRFDDMDSSWNFPCWLPLSNLFQRIVNFCAINIGASTFFVENPRDIINVLTEVNPHLLIGVPRVFEKIYDAINEQIEQKPLWQKKIINWAIQSGDQFAASTREGRHLSFIRQLQFYIANEFVLKKIRSFLGTNMRYFISGSAPMPKWLLEKYHAFGILVLEAYGISENIIPNTMNAPNDFKFGSVGRALPGNQFRIALDGELLVKGPGVFSGYFGNDMKKKSFTSDGYFSTGDYVSIDNGFLYVTGRKSEVFKTSTGRKIAPAGIENRICVCCCFRSE